MVTVHQFYFLIFFFFEAGINQREIALLCFQHHLRKSVTKVLE